MAITYMSGIQLPMQALVYKAPQTTNAITAHMFGMFLPSLFSGHRPYPKVLGSASLFFIDTFLVTFNTGIAIVGINRHYPKYATSPRRKVRC